MPANWQIGDRIQNRWEIHKILRGGMGIVYVVYDQELREAFAAKTFPDEIFARHPAIAERFTREALAWVNLDAHENITQARFVQQIEGKPYLFLEYVTGGDLSSWVGTPRLTEDLPEVLRLAIQFCDGMAHARTKGIAVHRDIKPQNCLITADRILKVSDFGLAKAFDAPGANAEDTREKARSERKEAIGLPGGFFGREQPPGEVKLESDEPPAFWRSLTQTGIAVGTLEYMAPEQFEDARSVDVRADIYSFGVMLFQMITGQLPFAGQTRMELERAHKTSAPPQPYTHSSLVTIVQTCLAKDPAKRFADFIHARRALADLYEVVVGGPVPAPVPEEKLDAVRLNNKGISLAALGRLDQAIECYDRAIAISPRYEQPWSNKGVSLDDLGRVEEAIECYNRAIQINPGNEQSWSNKGVSLASLGRREEAIKCHDRAITINPRYEKAWLNRGNSLLYMGRLEEAVQCYDHAIGINPRYEMAWFNKGASLAALGLLNEAIESYDRAITINPRLEQAWYNRGCSLTDLGRREEALRCYEHAIELNPRYEKALCNKGVSLDALGRREEAIECYDRAIQISPRDEKAWCAKGLSLEDLGRIEEAIECYDRAIQINPRDERPWCTMAVCLENLGRIEEAIECYDRAIEIQPRNEKAWHNKAGSLAALGRVKEAIGCYTCAIQINPRFAVAWYRKGAILLNSGSPGEAMSCFEQAQRLGFADAAHAISVCRQKLGT